MAWIKKAILKYPTYDPRVGEAQSRTKGSSLQPAGRQCLLQLQTAAMTYRPGHLGADQEGEALKGSRHLKNTTYSDT